MKINWGTGIIIAFISFIAFILFFIIKMSTNDKYSHDLVTKNYYAEELEYQDDIDKEKNAKSLKQNLICKKTSKGIIVEFPKIFEENNITGKVFLYRPSNKQFDFETSILLSDHNLLIPDNRLLDGRWNIKIYWKYNKISYLFKEKIMY